jgi:hypothetical protein
MFDPFQDLATVGKWLPKSLTGHACSKGRALPRDLRFRAEWRGPNTVSSPFFRKVSWRQFQVW